MGLGALVGRLDRWAVRFNRWFGGAALANSVAETGATSAGSPAVDPTSVVAVLGEIEGERDPEKDS